MAASQNVSHGRTRAVAFSTTELFSARGSLPHEEVWGQFSNKGLQGLHGVGVSSSLPLSSENSGRFVCIEVGGGCVARENASELSPKAWLFHRLAKTNACAARPCREP